MSVSQSRAARHQRFIAGTNREILWDQRPISRSRRILSESSRLLPPPVRCPCDSSKMLPSTGNLVAAAAATLVHLSGLVRHPLAFYTEGGGGGRIDTRQSVNPAATKKRCCCCSCCMSQSFVSLPRVTACIKVADWRHEGRKEGKGRKREWQH